MFVVIDCEPKRIARPDEGSKPFGGPSPWLLYTLLVTMAFLWSVNYIAGKIALRGSRLCCWARCGSPSLEY